MQEPLWELAEFEEAKHALEKERASLCLTGCVDSQKLHLADGLGGEFPCRLIVTYSDKRAREILEDYRLYDKSAVLYPAKDLIFYQADVAGRQLTKERMKTFRRILEGRRITVITTFSGLMTHQVPISALKKHVLQLSRSSTVEERALAEELAAMGYERVPQVEEAGQFSIRGGIVDIFDLTEENPYRVELWGDEVDSLRSFDVLSQRSIEELESLRIYPAREMVLTKKELEAGLEKIRREAEGFAASFRKERKPEEAHRVESQVQELTETALELSSMVNLESYLHYFYEEAVSFSQLLAGKAYVTFLDEPSRIREHADAVELEFRESMTHRLEKGYLLPGQTDLLFSADEVLARLQSGRLVGLMAMELKNTLFTPERIFQMTARSIASYNNSFESLVRDLKRYKKEGYRVLMLSGSRTRAARLARDLQEEGLTAFYTQDAGRSVQPGEVMLYYGHVRRGFEYPLIKFVVISESDIFGAVQKKKRKKKQYDGQRIKDFAELRVGDFVVHESHGLGVYQGIEKVEMDGVVKDYIKIGYRDGGNLYVLATGLDVIQKYASADAARTPKLNKLGTAEWSRTKAKVKTAVTAVAKDLVELYAARQQKEGFRFGRDTVWQREFEEMFPFEETEDQLAAIAAAKADMESGRIMDRLICGDVGYGKTEIAIRAAFKAVQDGKQVAFLVPTTILAQQHYNTFQQRMKDFPVRVDLLSRFRTPAEQKKTLADLKKGLVDIVIGTHRILSKDLEFKDLGLLIVDEEQRFGVTHKERIKKMKDTVDVLTLTATPIPRTLQMGLAGIRDMSVLEEAPSDRRPIQTYVMEYNEEMVREAIVRELSRGGQVYYVYNRVSHIADVAARVQELVPEATVAFAHGQMKEHELERIMYDFIAGEIDVLVSTTIIETGLDISNVNTMIIHDSDRLGLAQLYQLRGRVGRSSRTSYAFLMYKRDKMLKEVAEKRLSAIREFTDLGSGFKIAMRDLEIRGAGNLLGEAQHGHMAAVGYDLYCKMLNEAVRKEKGLEEEADFATAVDLDVDAFIPSSYIMNEVQKLDIYKRIAGIENETERVDMREELLDRFGAVPRSVENLLRIALIRVRAHGLYLTDVKGKDGALQLLFRPDAKLDPAGVPALLKRYGGKLKFTAKGGPAFLYRYTKCGMVEKDAEALLALTEKLLSHMEEALQESRT